jgi:hypothetical protein
MVDPIWSGATPSWLSRHVRESGVNYIIASSHPSISAGRREPIALWKLLQEACGVTVGPPVAFRYATRNPFNRGEQYEDRIYKLDLGRPECDRALAQMSR